MSPSILQILQNRHKTVNPKLGFDCTKPVCKFGLKEGLLLDSSALSNVRWTPYLHRYVEFSFKLIVLFKYYHIDYCRLWKYMNTTQMAINWTYLFIFCNNTRESATVTFVLKRLKVRQGIGRAKNFKNVKALEGCWYGEAEGGLSRMWLI